MAICENAMTIKPKGTKIPSIKNATAKPPWHNHSNGYTSIAKVILLILFLKLLSF